jgi:NAD(P)-dependent dehydrogenase (short-subunit alcohol dehydrogenase family)
MGFARCRATAPLPLLHVSIRRRCGTSQITHTTINQDTTSKGAVIHLGKTLCRALSPYNITVNTIAPGVFPSKMTKFMYENESLKNALENSNPLKRNGTTEDMAGTILYLISRAGAWTNGALITVDGGMNLHDAGMASSKM